jgi:hypothetical protein
MTPMPYRHPAKAEFYPLHPPAGGRGQPPDGRPYGPFRGEGAEESVRGTTHLTLPPLRDGPLPLPPEGP